MAFPVTTVLDDFNRAGPPKGTNWSDDLFSVWGGVEGLKINSSTFLQWDFSNAPDCWWNVSNFGPDCEVYVDFTSAVIQILDGLAVYARLSNPGSPSTNGFRAYWARTSTSFWTAQLQRLDSGVNTVIGSASIAGGAIPAWNAIGLEIIGSTITTYRRVSGVWISSVTATDTAYNAAGKIALEDNGGGGSSVLNYDNFGGGTATVTQKTYPDATNSAGSWTAVGAPTLWEAMDETTASSAEYIFEKAV